MGLFVLHNNSRYNFYSTISDSFVFESYLTLEQVKEYIRERNGEDGLSALQDRLERAYLKGTSSYGDKDIVETLYNNRCGKDETFMPIDECIRKFL